MSTKIKNSRPHYTAKPFSPPNGPNDNLLIDHLREVATGRDDISVECAGTIAGAWFATPVRQGHELIAAGLLMVARYVDLDELDRWVGIGWERRRGADIPYGPTG